MSEPEPRRRWRDRGLASLKGEMLMGGLAILFGVGGALIFAVFGMPGLIGALPCFGGVLLLLALLWGVLKLLEIAGRERE